MNAMLRGLVLWANRNVTRIAPVSGVPFGLWAIISLTRPPFVMRSLPVEWLTILMWIGIALCLVTLILAALSRIPLDTSPDDNPTLKEWQEDSTRA